MDVARMLVTKTNFIYYNIIENTVYKGSTTSKNLSALIKLKVSFEDIINGFTCNFMLDNDNISNYTINNKGNIAELIYTDSLYHFKKLYSFNPSNNAVTKYESTDFSGNNKMIFEYSDFNSVNSINFPNRIYVSRPLEKQNIYITYNNKSFNTNKLNYKLKIPKSARIINWD